MDNFLQIINDLQDVFNTVGVSPDIISLPQIVVVGSQSTGKSSVLEGIIGKSFLPRGTGIVTRRPLIIQIIHDVGAGEPRGQFLHDQDTTYTDFTKISEEIIRDTVRVCGENQTINSEPITLKIFSADLPTLTLVDLPGITKIPVVGQPEDIEEQTTSLVKKYIDKRNSIILAISPGNIDIANSEAIKLAKDVDKEGKRTLVVITKTDLMEKTTEYCKVLEGKVIPIELGIIGVINRTQVQIDEDISMAEVLRMEEDYFKTHYNYLSGQMGTPYLTQRLCQVLMHHVKECLPDLIIRITEQKLLQQNVIDSLGPRIVDEAGSLADNIMLFSQAFKDNMEGKRRVVLAGNFGKALSGGRHLFGVFEATVCIELEKMVLPPDIEKDILHEMHSAGGYKPALFTPNIVFDNLVSRQLGQFYLPIRKSVEKCSEALTEIISNLSKEMFERFPNLKKETHQLALSLLLVKTQLVEGFLTRYLKCELCYVNTNHRLFVKILDECEEAGAEDDNLSSEKKNVKKIKALLVHYIGIIRNQIMDVIPKTVVCFMVHEFVDDLHRVLMKELFSSTRIHELMKEDSLVEDRREKARKMLGALEKADAITSLLE